MQLLSLHTFSDTDAPTSTVLLEDSTVRKPLIQPRLLEALLCNVNPRRARRFLQHTKMVLSEVGEVVGEEVCLATQRSGSLGVVDLDFVGVEIQHQAEVVPYAWCERSLPQCLLRA